MIERKKLACMDEASVGAVQHSEGDDAKGIGRDEVRGEVERRSSENASSFVVFGILIISSCWRIDAFEGAVLAPAVFESAPSRLNASRRT